MAEPQRNPLCACGCGHEVKLPTQKFIYRHTIWSKLTLEQKRKIKRRLSQGENQYALAKEYGVSQSTISQLSWMMRWKDLRAHKEPAVKVIRQEQLDEHQRQTKERRSWQNGKTEYRKVKRFLKDSLRP